MVGLALVALLGLPGDAAAQRPAWQARVGMAWHGNLLCDSLARSRGLTAGIEAKTQGPWIASSSVDLMLDNWGRSCLDVGLPEFNYEGRLVSLRGSAWAGARIKVEAGHAMTIGGFRSELTGGAGLFPTHIDYGPGRSDFRWEPWYGGTLTVRLPRSGTGVQLELGRHRMTQRYYAVDTDALVDEIHYWRAFTRLGVTFPF